MANTIQTSASYSSTSPAISSAYQRLGGGTPIISSNTAGPKLKSIKESLMEREKAAREVDEELNPWNKTIREQRGSMVSRLLSAQKQGRERDDELMRRMVSRYGETPEAAGAYSAARDQRDLDWQRREMAAQRNFRG